VADVEFHPEARSDYVDALAWYQARSPRAASKFVTEVERVLDLIASMPELFPPYDDDHRFAVLKRFPFSIVYEVQPGRVWIVAVAHSARRPGYWQHRT
jgi:plasmid stabilization system protein ParE